jgi:hypothetical protein
VNRPVDDDRLDELIGRADLDDLVRLVDSRTLDGDWAGLLRLRDRCRAAVETGRQLWPAATLAEYRLALHAPAQWCARVLDEESGRFTIGPLSEVAAVHHTFDELAPHLSPGPTATYLAHERALRGEAIGDGHLDLLVPVIDIPVTPAEWEPSYPLAEYDDDGVHVDRPSPPGPSAEVVLPPAGGGEPAASVIDDPETALAVAQLLETWTTRSNGRVDTVCVEGDHLDAIAAIGPARARVIEVGSSHALALLAWAASSGGAHGRRRGMAIGRFGVWWLLATIGDLADPWPPDPAALGDVAGRLRWYLWDAFEPDSGWMVRLAVESPDDGLAWVIVADDGD